MNYIKSNEKNENQQSNTVNLPRKDENSEANLLSGKNAILIFVIIFLMIVSLVTSGLMIGKGVLDGIFSWTKLVSFGLVFNSYFLFIDSWLNRKYKRCDARTIFSILGLIGGIIMFGFLPPC